MNKNYLKNPVKLQFELSNMCNALCLGCIRTDTNNYNYEKNLIEEGKKYISFDTFKKILLAPEFETAHELEFCGTIDDPLMHPEFIEFLDFASGLKKNYNVVIHTNASLRNEKYWTKLTEVLHKHHRHIVKFSIDGLEDTNHIYRQNTVWSKIMANANAFIQAGGYASWQFLVFPWNEHQLMQAKQLSEEMGFFDFQSRHDRSRVTKIGLDRIGVLQRVDKHRRKAGLPDLATIRKPPVSSILEINESLVEDVFYEIECNNRKQEMYFIGYDSKLWPCCFLHNGKLDYDSGKRDLLEKRLFDAYGSKDWNDLSKHSVGEILNHPFYQEDLVNSWSAIHHSEEIGSRIHRCTETCNSKQIADLPIGQPVTL
jgi:MoaA/NifB/PqqE/SkfB family radical SAM enzyme